MFYARQQVEGWARNGREVSAVSRHIESLQEARVGRWQQRSEAGRAML